jgi:hypothetical protein
MPHLRGGATLDRSPELLDTLWGYYFGTGTYGPIARIIVLLPWSNDRDSLDKLTIGSMAKYTLASNAARDPALLTMLKRAGKNQPKDITVVLNEVIDAAETMEPTRCARMRLPRSRSSSARARPTSAMSRTGARSGRAHWRSAASPPRSPGTLSSGFPA